MKNNVYILVFSNYLLYCSVRSSISEVKSAIARRKRYLIGEQDKLAELNSLLVEPSSSNLEVDNSINSCVIHGVGGALNQGRQVTEHLSSSLTLLSTSFVINILKYVEI